jgi:CRP/FNR family transcriptional regulator, cyclic AMP receptor protein
MNQKPDNQALLRTELGQELEAEDCNVLTRVMGVRSLADGEVLAQEGDTSHTLFILVSGKLAVSSHINGMETLLYTMKPGECAGTRAFVERATRQATLTAVGDCVVYTLEPEDFEPLLDTHPKLVYRFMRGLFRLTHQNLVSMHMETQQLSNYILKTGGRY